MDNPNEKMKALQEIVDFKIALQKLDDVFKFLDETKNDSWGQVMMLHGKLFSEFHDLCKENGVMS